MMDLAIINAINAMPDPDKYMADKKPQEMPAEPIKCDRCGSHDFAFALWRSIQCLDCGWFYVEAMK